MSRLKNRLLVYGVTLIFMLASITVITREDFYYKPGDLDGDYDVTSLDVLEAFGIALELTSPSSWKEAGAGDVDDDGEITVIDARYIYLASIGLISLSDPTNLSPTSINLTTTTVEVTDSTQTDSDTAITVTAGVSDASLSQISSQKIYIYPDYSQLYTVENYFIIVTFGYGHCIGMSQFGALAMAEEGYSYLQILSYYYSDIEIYQESYPSTVRLGSKYVDTVEMLARIVQSEIGGYTSDNDYDAEALKAQAVAAYTNMKYSNYSVSGTTYVSSMSKVSDYVYEACAEVVGQYMTYNGSVIYAYYGSMSAGVTATTEAVWGTTTPGYIKNVASYWDCNVSGYITVKLISVSAMRNYILSYDSSITLSDDPADWLAILVHDDAVNEYTGYVYSMRIGDRTISSGAGMIFRDEVLNYAIKSPCFNIIYNGELL